MKTETKVQHTQEKLFVWTNVFGEPVIRAGGNKIATLSTMSDNGAIDRKEEAKANAAFITTACNSYYPLLDMLKYCLKRIENSEHWWMEDPERGGFDKEAIEATIKAAEQENQ